MALAVIQDILDGFPGWTTEFRIHERNQISGKENGEQIVKNLSPALWHMTARTHELSPYDLERWTAKIEGLDEGRSLFYGYHMGSRYPISYPRGTWPTGVTFNGFTAQISVVNADNRRLSLKSLPAGFQFRIGDRIAFLYASGASWALHRVMEDVTANGSGVTAQFEVRPIIRTGWALDTVVRVKQPWCVMKVVPGSFQTSASEETGRGVVSFSGVQELIGA